MPRSAILALLLILPLPAPAQEAPSNLPDTPVARIFRSWLRAVNSRDSALAREQVLRYETRTPGDSAAVVAATRRMLRIGRQSGGFSVEEWRASGPDAMNLILRDSSGTRVAMHLAVERVSEAWRVAVLEMGAPGRLQAPGARQQQAPPARPGPQSSTAAPPGDFIPTTTRSGWTRTGSVDASGAVAAVRAP